MYSIDACIVCGEKRRTIVCEFNRLIFLDSMWQSDLARFDYALCHGCGLVYATRRPDRKEYDFLYENFGEFLMRKPNPKSFNQPVLPPAMAEEIDRDFLPWWEVGSDENESSSIRRRLQHDLKTALRLLPFILQNVPLEGAKVLHIRAKGSTLADMLKRLVGAAQVDLITLFPPHQYMAEKNEGIRAQNCLDYEDFKIPFDEKYDLIISNHILLHMLDASQTFEVFRSHLTDGGRLFLIGELSDEELYRKGKNLLAELRPFHYQQFDPATVERMFRRFGFEPMFVHNAGHGDPELLGMATLRRDLQEGPRLSSQELDVRLSMYRRWLDESILSLPKERAEALYGTEMSSIWARVQAEGRFAPDKKGVPLAYRPFPEAEMGEEELAIAPAFADIKNGVYRDRSKASRAKAPDDARGGNWLSAALPGTRVADWVSAKLYQRNKAKERAARAGRSKRA